MEHDDGDIAEYEVKSVQIDTTYPVHIQADCARLKIEESKAVNIFIGE